LLVEDAYSFLFPKFTHSCLLVEGFLSPITTSNV
jgi:hypothetical protein